MKLERRANGPPFSICSCGFQTASLIPEIRNPDFFSSFKEFTLKKAALGLSAVLLTAACMDVDPKYSDLNESAANGFPELALQLGRVNPPKCVLQASEWEPVFIKNNITTGHRVTNALNGMVQNGQILYFQDKRVIAVTAAYCGK
ncbi:hypothetical protein KUW17_09065 [Leisingera aquaemixtae]|uniref:hypothetical protein n=1 Tax=Leisingera aquaemixtae TaxID=1396826 RepID=UPI001C97FD2D|nr:hypothetical protein [Leisingera aquaemixtae]MBY6066890.1 hypothetical protein [Leisingera aquaemixtae]